MAKMYKVPGTYRKLFRRYISKYFPGEEKEILAKTDRIYDGFKRETHDLGGKKNLLAGNLDLGLAFFAFCEASDMRVTGEAVEELGSWMFSKMSFVSRIADFNRPWLAKLMYKVYEPYVKKVEKYKANGEWGNTWGIELNPEGYTEGCSFHLIGCPLVEFAKSHGYMDIMPYLCTIDHMSASIMNAKLLRSHTVAEGAERCDYWYVGNKSTAIKTE